MKLQFWGLTPNKTFSLSTTPELDSVQSNPQIILSKLFASWFGLHSPPNYISCNFWSTQTISVNWWCHPYSPLCHPIPTLCFSKSFQHQSLFSNKSGNGKDGDFNNISPLSGVFIAISLKDWLGLNLFGQGRIKSSLSTWLEAYHSLALFLFIITLTYLRLTGKTITWPNRTCSGK